MKIIFSILFLGANMLFAQHIEGGYLKSCDNLKSSEAKIACTDSTLLEDVRLGWSEIKNEIEPGSYYVTYYIYSGGRVKAERIILVPQRVVFNSKPESLLELVDRSVKKREWISNDRVEYVIIRDLKINTTVL